MYTEEEIKNAFLKWYTLQENEVEQIDLTLLSFDEKVKESQEMAQWIINTIEEERLNLPVVN